MSAKFTKGKWVVDNSGYFTKVLSDKVAICEMKTTPKNILHNANLMATAPDMYAEIQSDIEELEDKLLDVSKVSGDYDFIVGRIKHKESLLAKARGEL